VPHRMLQGTAFDDQAVKAMTAAYEATLPELGLTDSNDPLTEIVASKIITYYQKGECDPQRLCKLALKDIRG
jgi:hypothetical protein